jgi:hypothetical protein
MSIDEGASSNYTQSMTSWELAVVSSADDHDPKKERVVTVPGKRLRNGAKIEDDKLPFSVEVVRYLANSKLEKADGDNSATAGRDVVKKAVEKPEVSGTDQDQKVDMPSVYVRLRDRQGKDLGVYLFSTHLKPDTVAVDAPQAERWWQRPVKKYEVSLRFARTYKPYTIRLLQADHDVYPGTTIPKNYSSRILLIDPENHEEREVTIRMNEPLRYRGDTFYQSQMSTDEFSGVRTTGLQVVRNPGWLMPYVSCCVVALGMLIHFGLSLTTFLRRRAAS